MVILFSALLGVLARQWWQSRSVPPHYGYYLALGVVVQLMQLAAFTQLPDRAGHAFIEQAWWILLLFYPLATALLCLIFRNYEQQFEERAALQAAQKAVIAEERANMERFHAYFDHSIIGLAITSQQKGWIEVNDALCQTLGYTRDELTHMTWTELTYPADLAPDLAQFNSMLAGEINSYAMDKRFIHKVSSITNWLMPTSERLKTPAERRGEVFADYMTVRFQLAWPEAMGLSGHKKGRTKANYIRMIRGWSFDADSREGAVLKGWVESRFGLMPRWHGESLRDPSGEAYTRYMAARATLPTSPSTRGLSES